MADLILAEKIAEIRQRLQSLQNPTILMPPHVDEAVEELQVTLEELRVAQEELEERTAELADANEILEQERRRYYELFNFTPGGSVVTTPEGIIREANRAIADMLHVPQNRLAGKPFILYVSDTDKRAVREWLASFGHGAVAGAGGVGRPGLRETKEFELQPRSGSPVPASVTLAPIHGTDGSLQGFRWLCLNISDQKRAEAERGVFDARLQETQRLEGLAVLAGGVAHDFNNLLTTVLGSGDMALASLAAADPARVHLDAIILAAHRATDLSNQLLAFSGRGKFVVEPVCLQQFIMETQPLLETAASSRCRIQYDLSPGAVIEADLTQLRQVVMNLILNAAEATGDHGGTIWLRVGTRACERSDLATCVLGQDLPAGRYAVIEVADAGCGMTRETKARIFEPFFSTKQRGRGLGLAAVLGIVRGHHGALEVSSSLGHGTTIRVFLPVSQLLPAAPALRPPAAAPAKGSGTILVVDDEASLRKLAQSILESDGYTVLTAVDGVEAAEVFRAHAHEIRAVLLDLTMPRMCGLEALRHLRQLDAHVFVVLTSGFTDLECLGPLNSDPHARFLQKPYRKAELLGLLQTALASAETDRR